MDQVDYYDWLHNMGEDFLDPEEDYDTGDEDDDSADIHPQDLTDNQ